MKKLIAVAAAVLAVSSVALGASVKGNGQTPLDLEQPKYTPVAEWENAYTAEAEAFVKSCQEVGGQPWEFGACVVTTPTGHVFAAGNEVIEAAANAGVTLANVAISFVNCEIQATEQEDYLGMFAGCAAKVPGETLVGITNWAGSLTKTGIARLGAFGTDVNQVFQDLFSSCEATDVAVVSQVCAVALAVTQAAQVAGEAIYIAAYGTADLLFTEGASILHNALVKLPLSLLYGDWASAGAAVAAIADSTFCTLISIVWLANPGTWIASYKEKELVTYCKVKRGELDLADYL